MMDGNSNEWVVAFHGFRTPDFVLPKAINEGMRVGFNNAYGVGIYCTPHIAIAKSYAGTMSIDGKEYYTVF
jgi:hypothetical protein